MLSEAASRLLDALAWPFTLPFNSEERLYWPFLLAAMVIAAMVLFRRRVRGETPGIVGPPPWSLRLWWHPSARLDYKLLVVRPLLRALLFAPVVVSSLAVSIWVVRRLDGWFGMGPPLEWPRWALSAVYTLVLFVAWDASRFVVHLLLHRVPLLWEFHKVHHSAEVLTPLTVHRIHPVESLLFSVRGVLVGGTVTGVFFFLFRDAAVQYELVGINVFGFAFNLFGANLRHSGVWLSWGPKLERVFLSPAQHQLHHSRRAEECQSNFGSCLAIWDRLAGTLKLARDVQQPLVFGLPASVVNHAPDRLLSALLGPFAACWRRLVGRRTARFEPAGR